MSSPSSGRAESKKRPFKSYSSPEPFPVFTDSTAPSSLKIWSTLTPRTTVPFMASDPGSLALNPHPLPHPVFPHVKYHSFAGPCLLRFGISLPLLHPFSLPMTMSAVPPPELGGIRFLPIQFFSLVPSGWLLLTEIPVQMPLLRQLSLSAPSLSHSEVIYIFIYLSLLCCLPLPPNTPL